MVNIGNMPPVTPATSGVKKRVSEVETHTDERRAVPHPKPLIERRKQSDRRRQQNQRSLYDMRGNRGRRKTDRDGFKSIDIDV